MIEVLVVDDEPLVRASIRSLLKWEDHGFSFAREAANGLEALSALESSPVDIVLLDMNMPKCDGIEFMKRLRQRGPEPAVVVLSAFDDFSLVRDAFTLGALDYVLKADMQPAGVLAALREAARIVQTPDRSPPLRDERLTQQILRDFLLDENDHDFEPLLTQVGVPLTFPLIPCEIRANLPGANPRTAETVRNYARSTLDARSRGVFVVLADDRMAWLNFADRDETDDTTRAESTCRELAELTMQSLNVVLEWAVGPIAREQTSVSASFLAAERLFGGHSRAVVRAKAYVAERYADPNVSLAETAAYAGVSRTHLSALFPKECGVGFGDYLTSVRIDAARKLLEETPLKVYEVAEEVGYASAEHFSRSFKRVTGISPNRYGRS